MGDCDRQLCRDRHGARPLPRQLLAKPRQSKQGLVNFTGLDGPNRLEDLARKYTRPRQSEAYRDPEHVKQARKPAKLTKTAQAWKHALGLRKKARQEWQASRVARAVQGEWKIFRQLTDKQEGGWDVSLAEAAEEAGEDRHQWIVKHFTAALTKTGAPAPEEEWTKGTAPAKPFSLEEPRDAIAHARMGKSVGLT